MERLADRALGSFQTFKLWGLGLITYPRLILWHSRRETSCVRRMQGNPPSLRDQQIEALGACRLWWPGLILWRFCRAQDLLCCHFFVLWTPYPGGSTEVQPRQKRRNAVTVGEFTPGSSHCAKGKGVKKKTSPKVTHNRPRHAYLHSRPFLTRDSRSS